MSANVNLWIRMHHDDEYRSALSIPGGVFHNYSLRPFKWLCFLGYTIHGREGDISSVPDDMAGTVDYDAEDVAPGDYYYLSKEDARLLDLRALDDRTSTASDIPARNSNFRSTVLDRDKVCIVTGMTQASAACHIIPHSKGNQYLKNLIGYRRQTIQPVLEYIDDPRNGILLNVLLRKCFGEGLVAFLSLPNFIMDFDDVAALPPKPAALAAMQFPGNLMTMPNRLIYQNFTLEQLLEDYFGIHNRVARRAIDSATFPPSFLFDIGYGIAAYKAWGISGFKTLATARTNTFYYAGADTGGGGGSGNGNGGERRGGHDGGGAGRKRKWQDVEPNHRMTLRSRTERQRSTQATRQKQETAQEDDEIDAADFILGLWMYNAEMDIRKARELQEKKNRDSVEKWLENVV